ncbi:MAG: cell wall-binding repeat-containing protein [Coriobacteriia bacterium]|nr:cell wall-binding repeat-containing protein [Coriobacteriia bacterium]MBN2821572.1 cell wall-binding repeat-containing protein [Coriobacteriia bacterium]
MSGAAVRSRVLALAVLFAVGLTSLAPVVRPAQAAVDVSVRLQALWRVSQPTAVESANDGSGRLFILEKGGKVRVVRDGALLGAPFLDISALVSTESERGLLGIAFPPDFASKQYFYVDYTNLAGNTVVARYSVSASDPDRASPSSGQQLLTVSQPYSNHNGGQLAFGPDGYLYVGLGDGGGTGDPAANAQNPSSLLGKILRIDPENTAPSGGYAVPADNPYVGVAGYRPEIWALGLRNPWRFSFDALTGDLWIADVGQNAWEEIDFQGAGSSGGENYGWDFYEGTHPYPADSTPYSTVGLTFPVYEYNHATGGHSVTGGYVYRGSAYPAFEGLYFFSDFEWGRIWAMDPLDHSTKLLLDDTSLWTTFGADEAGEIYIADYVSGLVYRLADGAQPPAAPLDRLDGNTRYETAMTIAEEAFPSGAETAVIVTGEQFPDAVCGSALAGAVNGPLLLTRKTALPSGLPQLLGPSGLDVGDIYVIGGDQAIEPGVVAALEAAGHDVTRVAGRDRYATAASVASRVVQILGSEYAGGVFVTRGDEFPDALASAPLAYAGHGPVLLVQPASLPRVTADTLVSIGATDAIVVGGTAAVSDSVAAALGIPYVRSSGADRYATAVALAKEALDRNWTRFGYVGVATGTAYPDGLTGGAAAGTRQGVLLLTRSDRLSAVTGDLLMEQRAGIDGAAVYGGTAAVSSATFEQLRWHVP